MARSWMGWGLGGAALLCAAGAWYAFGLPPFGAPRPQAEAKQPLQIQAAQVRQVTLPVLSDYTGIVVSPLDAELQARVSGYVMQRPFIPGATVKKGDLLFAIDPRPFATALAEASGQREQAQAQVDYYQAEVDRYKPLARRGFASQERLQMALRNRDQAEGQVRVTAAQIARQRLNLDYAAVRASFDGRTGVTNVNVGDLVTPDQTNLVRLIQLTPLRIQIAASKPDADAVQAALKAGAQPVIEIIGENGEARPRKARIDILDNRFDAATARLLVRAIIDNPDGALIPGEYLHVRLNVGAERHLVVPSAALSAQLDQRIVYVIKNGKAHVQQVQTGEERGGMTVVTDGLTEGEAIAADHLQHLNDGDPVTVENSRAAQQAGS